MRTLTTYLHTFAAAVAFGGATLAADKVVTSDGAAVEGQITQESDSEVVMNVGGRSVSYQRSAIKELIVDSDARTEYKKRREAITSGDAKAHYGLAQWCKLQHFHAFAEAELRATLAADANHEQARKALGYVQKDGKWLAFMDANEGVADAQEKEEGAGDENFVIGLRPQRAHIWQERLYYYNQAVDVCKMFAPDSTTDTQAKTDALNAFLAKDKNRAIEGLLGCLDARNAAELNVRLGALKVIEHAKLTHPNVSIYLAAASVGDADKSVRAAALELIKARKDDPAIGQMIQYFLAAYSKTGQVLNAVLRDNAVAAVKELGDRRIYQQLNYYVTMEMRATKTDLKNFATRQIDSFSVNNGANVNVLVLLSFPIQFPELEIQRVRTTVKCPASTALEDLTGQRFGMDDQGWAEWIRRNIK